MGSKTGNIGLILGGTDAQSNWINKLGIHKQNRLDL